MTESKRKKLEHIIDIIFQGYKESIIESVLDESAKCSWVKPDELKDGENIETKKTTTFDKLRDSFFAVLYINQLTEMSKGQKGMGGELDLVEKAADTMKNNNGFRVTITINDIPFDPEAFFERLQLGYDTQIARESARIVSELIGFRLSEVMDSLDSFKHDFEHLVHMKLNEIREMRKDNGINKSRPESENS